MPLIHLAQLVAGLKRTVENTHIEICVAAAFLRCKPLQAVELAQQLQGKRHARHVAQCPRNAASSGRCQQIYDCEVVKS